MEVYMIVNFITHEISRAVHKLIQIPTLIKKTIFLKKQLFL